MRLNYLVCVALCAFLVGCDQATLMKKLTRPEDESAARNYVELLRQRELDQIESDLDPSLRSTDARDQLAGMATFLPHDAPRSIKVVGAKTFSNPTYSTADITLEYEFQDQWLLANVVTKRTGLDSTLIGFHVTPIPDSLENLNRFTLVGKSGVQYFVLILALCFFAFSLYALVLCIQTKNLRAKWAWMLVVLIGVGKVGINWSTGDWNFMLFAFQLPCAGANAALYGPWTVGAYLPLGAIIFLNHRWKMKITGELIEPPVTHHV